jgi:hypothetical protein
MGQVLFELLKGRNLRLYHDEELRQQGMNTVAIETPRGFRIAKEKASRKIDAIVAPGYGMRRGGGRQAAPGDRVAHRHWHGPSYGRGGAYDAAPHLGSW